MKNQIQKFLTIFFIVLVSGSALAENLIMENTPWSSKLYEFPGKGYYLFYRSNNENPATKRRVKILDYNYAVTGEGSFELAKLEFAGPSVSNGSALVCSYLDPKAKVIRVLSFDHTGAALGSLSFTDSKMVTPQMHAFMPLIEIIPANDGFIIMTSVRKNQLNYHFKLTKVDNQLNTIWSKEFTEDENELMVNDFTSINNEVFLSYVAGPATANDPAKYSQYVVKLDVGGNENFKYKLAESNYFAPVKITPDGEEIMVSGTIHSDKKTIGVSLLRLNSKGEKISESLVTWSENLGVHLPVTENLSKHKEAPRFLIHELIKNTDGSFTMITEAVYTEASSTPGHGTQNAGSTAVKFILSDFIVLHFDSEGKFQNSSVIEKYERDISLTGTEASFNGNPTLMQTYLASGTTFNYKFLKNYNGKTYMAFTNYSKSEAGKTFTFLLADLTPSEEILVKPVFTKSYNYEADGTIMNFVNAAESKIILYSTKTDASKSRSFFITDLSTF